MNIKQAISRLKGDMVIDVMPSLSPCVATKFFYPNGDSINLYLFRSKGKIVASDLGATIDSLSQSGVDISHERRTLIQSICQREEIDLKENSFSKTLRPRAFKDDFVSMCQSLMYVASLHFHQQQANRSMLPEALASLLQKRVKPKRSFQKQWKDSRIDPEGVFPVDYHFNGEKPPRNLFYVTSGGKALLVTAVVQFLRANNVTIPTMAIVDKDADVNTKQIERLQISSDELKFGVAGNEQSIVKFALA